MAAVFVAAVFVEVFVEVLVVEVVTEVEMEWSPKAIVVRLIQG